VPTVPVLAEFAGRTITNPYLFFGAAGLLIAYILYMMIRKRQGERPGDRDREPEL
jgi:hypothetical protein